MKMKSLPNVDSIFSHISNDNNPLAPYGIECIKCKC